MQVARRPLDLAPEAHDERAPEHKPEKLDEPKHDRVDVPRRFARVVEGSQGSPGEVERPGDRRKRRGDSEPANAPGWARPDRAPAVAASVGEPRDEGELVSSQRRRLAGGRRKRACFGGTWRAFRGRSGRGRCSSSSGSSSNSGISSGSGSSSVVAIAPAAAAPVRKRLRRHRLRGLVPSHRRRFPRPPGLFGRARAGSELGDGAQLLEKIVERGRDFVAPAESRDGGRGPPSEVGRREKLRGRAREGDRRRDVARRGGIVQCRIAPPVPLFRARVSPAREQKLHGGARERERTGDRGGGGEGHGWRPQRQRRPFW